MRIRGVVLNELVGRVALPLAAVTTVAAFSGQQGPPGRDERRNEWLEKPLEGDSAVGLTGHESAVDGGERKARELVSGRGARIVPERDRDLRPQQIECVLADAADDGLYLPVARGRRLRGEGDQQPEEVRMAVERVSGGRHDPDQVLCRTPGLAAQVRQVGEEAIGAAFHDGQQDPVFGAEVMVHRAHRDAGFLHNAGKGRGFEAVLGHDPFGGVQHAFARPHAPAVRLHFSGRCHTPTIAQVL